MILFILLIRKQAVWGVRIKLTNPFVERYSMEMARIFRLCELEGVCRGIRP